MATIRPTGYLAHYGFSEEDVLEHYGVKGMKWGKHLKAKISQLSDQYITGRSAKEAHGNATRDMYLNALKKAAVEDNRQNSLQRQAEHTAQSKKYSDAASKALNTAAKYSLKANDAKNEHKKLYAESMSGVNLTAKLKKYVPKLTETRKAYEYNSRAAEVYANDAKSLSTAAKKSEKDAQDAKQKAAREAQKLQGYTNSMHAANAKAVSAKRKYDKTVAGKIGKGKQKIMKFLGRG